MDNYVFELKDVVYSYLGQYPALCGLSLNIRQGDKIAVIGANGCGKSTFLQMLDGLIFPDRGTIRAFGCTLTERVLEEGAFALDFRKRVGLVFQNPDVQLFCPTVKEDILFGPLQLGAEKEVIKKRFADIVETMNIGFLLDRAVHQLSIGEKRKVAIASVLMVDPEVFILDEPTAGLDPLTTRHIMDILTGDSFKGKTIITSTHDLHIVEEIAEMVHVFSQDKKIIKSASPGEILSDMSLLEANNLVHIHRHKHKGQEHVHPHQHRHIDYNHPHEA